ncbi:MAG: ABC transporter ATP-binding protein [Streptosporangiaceae bacterium]
MTQATEAAVSRTAAAVRLSGVSKAFGSGSTALLALDNVSLDVAPGEFVCLLGASGCGKSTLLNLVADLDKVSAGRIDVGGNRVALMFQEPALFPWLTVSGNLELALRMRGVPRSQRRGRASELLKSVHLGGFDKKRPHQLSGGMRQRVALARALALTIPEEGAADRGTVLLMDEPFGALDAMTRDLLHDEIERIWRERNLTILFVTHNVREAVRLGDRVVLLSSRPGRVIEDFPVEFDRPRRIDSPEVSGLAATITDRLKEEVSRHGS